MPHSEDPIINVELALMAGQDGAVFSDFVAALRQSSQDIASTAASLKAIAASYEKLRVDSAVLERSRSNAPAGEKVGMGASEGASAGPSAPAPSKQGDASKPENVQEGFLQSLSYFNQLQPAAAVGALGAGVMGSIRNRGETSGTEDGGASTPPPKPNPYVSGVTPSGLHLSSGAIRELSDVTPDEPEEEPDIRSFLQKAKSAALSGEFVPDKFKDPDARRDIIEGWTKNFANDFVLSKFIQHANRQNVAQDVYQGGMMGEDTLGAAHLGPFSLPFTSDAAIRAFKNQVHDLAKGAFTAGLKGSEIEQLRQNAFDVGITGAKQDNEGEKHDMDAFMDASTQFAQHNKAIALSPQYAQLARETVFGGNASMAEFNQHLGRLVDITKNLNISVPQMLDDLQSMVTWAATNGGMPLNGFEQQAAIYGRTGMRTEVMQPLLNSPVFAMNAVNKGFMPWETGLMGGNDLVDTARQSLQMYQQFAPHLPAIKEPIKNEKGQTIGYRTIPSADRDRAFMSKMLGLPADQIKSLQKQVKADTAFGSTVGNINDLITDVNSGKTDAQRKAILAHDPNLGGLGMAEVQREFNSVVSSKQNADLFTDGDRKRIKQIQGEKNNTNRLRDMADFLTKKINPEIKKGGTSDTTVTIDLSDRAAKAFQLGGGKTQKQIQIAKAQAGQIPANTTVDSHYLSGSSFDDMNGSLFMRGLGK